MGYAMIVCDCDESRSTSARPAHSPHFDIDEAFKAFSYLDRFHILCDRLRRKSLYNAVCSYSRVLTKVSLTSRIHP